MPDTETIIECPECGSDINISKVQQAQIMDTLKHEFEAKYKKRLTALESKQQDIEEKATRLKIDRENMATLTEQKVASLLKEKERDLREVIKKQVDTEQSQVFQNMKSELEDKSRMLRDLNKKAIENERLIREKNEIEDRIRLEAETDLNNRLKIERGKIKEFAEQKYELEIVELNKKLTDQKRLTDEMRRKQEQGSTQLQGEVQEIAIEGWLSKTFLLDEIKEVKKGVKGADCLQIINTRDKTNCGSIYYESKRVNSFQESWIEKLKDDMREKNADIGVLVVEVLPKDMVRFGKRSGIWVCSFSEYKGLAGALRENLISVNAAVSVQENKGDKMTALYNYLTSNEFKLQVEVIVTSFQQMMSDLDSEKRAMQTIWKKREKQIDKVLTGTVSMFGSVKGLLGREAPLIESLELGGLEQKTEE